MVKKIVVYNINMPVNTARGATGPPGPITTQLADFGAWAGGSINANSSFLTIAAGKYGSTSTSGTVIGTPDNIDLSADISNIIK
jgi:hypothetical protein